MSVYFDRSRGLHDFNDEYSVIPLSVTEVSGTQNFIVKLVVQNDLYYFFLITLHLKGGGTSLERYKSQDYSMQTDRWMDNETLLFLQKRR